MDMPLGTLPAPDTHSRSELVLKRLADALGQPVAVFTDPEQMRAHANAAELLQLWQAITTQQGRDAALASMKRIVEAQAD